MRTLYYVNSWYQHLENTLNLRDSLPGSVCCSIKDVYSFTKKREGGEVHFTRKPRSLLKQIKKYRPDVVCYPAIEPDIIKAVSDINPKIVQVYIRHGIGLKVFDNDAAFWAKMIHPPANIDIILTGGETDREQYDGKLSAVVEMVPDTWVKYDRFVNGQIESFSAGFASDFPTVLWCPTIGRWSSFEIWFDQIIAAFRDSDYNLLIKPHSVLFSWFPGKIAEIQKMNARNIKIVPNDINNILPVFDDVDILLSDISSAAIEYLHFKKPIVFLMNENVTRDELFYGDTGEIIYPGDGIMRAIGDAIENNDGLSGEKNKWCEAVWGKIDGKASLRAANAIREKVER